MQGSDPLLLGEISAVVIILTFVGHPPGGMGLDYSTTPFLLLASTVVPSLHL